MFSIVRENFANNYFPASFTPLAEHFLLYMTTMNLSIFYRVSELTSTGCRSRSRKASVTDGQELHTNHADFFPRPRKLDTVSRPLIAWKNSNAFSFTCFTISMEQNARICHLMGTWLEILDVAHVILCGDDRFILCADEHLSASFAKLYAIGQIAKQLIFVSITPQESIPVRRNRRSCNHALSLCVLRFLVDCFRMSVRYLSKTRSTLLTVSSREVIYGRNICWE